MHGDRVDLLAGLLQLESRYLPVALFSSYLTQLLEMRGTLCLCPVKAYPLTFQALLGFAHGMLCCLEVLRLKMQLCLRIPRTLTCRSQLLCYLQTLASLQGLNLATHTVMLRLSGQIKALEASEGLQVAQ